MQPEINISTRVPNRFRNAAGAVNTIIAQAHRRAAAEGIAILKEQIRRSGAIATFDLYNSPRERLKARGSRSAWYTREIFFSGRAGKYWRFVENDTRAHWPPIAPLIRWAQAIGSTLSHAFATQRKIAEEGTEGKHFVRNAAPRIRRRAREIMQAARREVVKYFEGRG